MGNSRSSRGPGMAVLADRAVGRCGGGRVRMGFAGRAVRDRMADGSFTSDVVYGRSGVVLYIAAYTLAGQASSRDNVWDRSVCPAFNGEYFFGGGHQDDRFVPGGGSGGVCHDYVDGIFAVRCYSVLPGGVVVVGTANNDRFNVAFVAGSMVGGGGRKIEFEID